MTKYYEIPHFKISYTRRDHEDEVHTICQIVALDDGEKMAFGVSKINKKMNYNPVVAKRLAFSKAMWFLFIKAANGEQIVIEDGIKESKPELTPHEE